MTFLIGDKEQEDILNKLKQKHDGINANIDQINAAIKELNDSSETCLKDIHKHCDSLISIIEQHRQKLLKTAENLKNQRMKQYDTTLTALQLMEKNASNTTNECIKIVNTPNMSKSYKLIGLKKMVNEHYNNQNILNINQKQFNNYHNSKLIVNYAPQDIDHVVSVNLSNEILLKYKYNLSTEKKINIRLTPEIKHEILIEHWFRILLNRSNVISDIANIISTYADRSGYHDEFVEQLARNVFIDNNILTAEMNVNRINRIKGFAFGSMIVHEMNDRTHWRLKVMNGYNIWFGVLENNKCINYVRRGFFALEDGYWYSGENGTVYYESNGSLVRKLKKYGERISKGDIIDIWLNLEKRTLSFAKNNQKYGTACKVKKNKEYRLGIIMNKANDSIKLEHVDDNTWGGGYNYNVPDIKTEIRSKKPVKQQKYMKPVKPQKYIKPVKPQTIMPQSYNPINASKVDGKQKTKNCIVM